MNRFSKAWLALTGRLPVEAVFAESAALTTIYKVSDYSFAGMWSFESERRYYATCEQAHTAEPGRSVNTVKVVKIDGKLYRFPQDRNLWEVTLQPKPKRAKGRA